MKSRFVGLDGEQCTVEEFALQHYATEDYGGWKGELGCSDRADDELLGHCFEYADLADVKGEKGEEGGGGALAS